MSKKQNIRSWHVVEFHGLKAGVFGWVWDYVSHCPVMEFLFWYYINYDTAQMNPQTSEVRAFGIWAGFMSEARGEHWDNKSRRGIK